MADQFHGPADQALAAGRAPGARAPFKGGAGAGAAPTAAAADFVQGQEGEPAGAAALEQLDRPGGDAVVIDHHLAKPGTGGHLQGQAVRFAHLPELGNRPMDALQARLQQ